MSDARLRSLYRNYRSDPTPENEALLIREFNRAGLRDTADYQLFVVGDRIIEDEQVKGLLCSGIEGGINYWAASMDYVFSPGYRREDFVMGGAMQGEDYWHPSQIIPLVPGCAVIVKVYDEPGKTFRLDRETIQRGLSIMQTEHPRHWADFVGFNEDAITGDVFIQCCIFGDIIYG